MIKKIIKKIKRVLRRMFKPPYISVIVPVYNCEKYLDEALDSLLNQSLKDIEIICIDDESTDASYEILKEYAKKNRRIKAFQQPHSNAGNARNLGISKAKGKYLLFLDSDDIFDKDLCKTAYHYANYYDTDILLYTAKIFDEKTGKYSESNALLDKTFIEMKKVYSSYDLREHLFHITAPNPWTKLYSKKFIKENNLKFQSLSNSNDLYFTRISLVLAKRIVAIDEKLVNYRTNSGGSTQDKKYKMPLNFIKAFLALKEELENRNLMDVFNITYVNSLITTILYNYNSNNDKAKKEIMDYLKKGGLKELGIDNINEEEIYAKTKYKEYKELMAKEGI